MILDGKPVIWRPIGCLAPWAVVAGCWWCWYVLLMLCLWQGVAQQPGRPWDAMGCHGAEMGWGASKICWATTSNLHFSRADSLPCARCCRLGQLRLEGSSFQRHCDDCSEALFSDGHVCNIPLHPHWMTVGVSWVFWDAPNFCKPTVDLLEGTPKVMKCTPHISQIYKPWPFSGLTLHSTHISLAVIDIAICSFLRLMLGIQQPKSVTIKVWKSYSQTCIACLWLILKDTWHEAGRAQWVEISWNSWWIDSHNLIRSMMCFPTAGLIAQYCQANVDVFRLLYASLFHLGDATPCKKALSQRYILVILSNNDRGAAADAGTLTMGKPHGMWPKSWQVWRRLKVFVESKHEQGCDI